MREGYVVANGIRVFYVEEGSGPLVLLLHGFPELSFSWRDQLGPVGAAGHRCVAIDLPGYGRSDKPDVTYDVVWLTDCLSGVIAGLGHDRAVLAGHDWGGLLAWPFARFHPEQTAGVIGLNTPDLPRGDAPPVERMRARGSSATAYIVAFQERGASEAAFEANPRAFLELFFRGPAAVHKEVFSDEVVDVYLRAFGVRGAITPPLEYYRNLDRNWELTAHHDGVKIDVPCLMISAAGDPVLRPELADGMEARVPDLDKVVIEDCGHWTQQEQPQATTEAMLAYLDRLGPWT